MIGPTLWDIDPPRPVETIPAARLNDPATSKQAADAVKRGNGALVSLIRDAVRLLVETHERPVTADQIVNLVTYFNGDRWARGTIVSAISRADLTVVEGETGLSDRGQPCSLYRLP